MNIKKISDLEKKIGYTFKNKNLIIEALTHRSFLNENPDFNLDHNERLEFLGDAVLELLITEFLFKNYINSTEGEMTNYRAALVKGENLAKVAKKINLESYLQMSRGEKNYLLSKDYITSNAVESIIAAMYIDGGLEVVNVFLNKYIIVDLEDIIQNNLFVDSKSLLQEKMQEKFSITPSYKVMSQWGPDHSKTFEVAVFMNEIELARGIGSSKQKAEQQAAKILLELKYKN